MAISRLVRSGERAVRRAALVAASVALAFGAAPSRADGVDIAGLDTFSLSGDIRLVAADGERSWIDRGFGKGRFGGSGHPRIKPTEASLVWRPQFGWSLSGTVVATAQQGQQHAVDLSEGFLNFKPPASGPVRYSVRAGLFWPPISLEHSGADWTVTDTITPSAINSWIGEEVKVAAIEGNVSFPLGSGRIALTGALFGFNDTAGTLLAYRGWALHDEMAVAFGRQVLPPQNAFISFVQANYTRPIIELDDRPGYYAKLAWSPPAPLRVEYLHYDNRADPQKVNSDLQWGWHTRFESLGLLAQPTARLTVRAQAMTGRTRMGFPVNGVIWIDTQFRAAYLMATRAAGDGSVSARIEAFGTRNHGSELLSDDNDHGWAGTIAARRPIGRHLALVAEIEHVESRHPSRTRLGLAPQQSQTWGQLALRVKL